jgi:hypothetical protein
LLSFLEVVDKNSDGFIYKSEFHQMAKNLSKEQVKPLGVNIVLETIVADPDQNPDP